MRTMLAAIMKRLAMGGMSDKLWKTLQLLYQAGLPVDVRDAILAALQLHPDAQLVEEAQTLFPTQQQVDGLSDRLLAPQPKPPEPPKPDPTAEALVDALIDAYSEKIPLTQSPQLFKFLDFVHGDAVAQAAQAMPADQFQAIVNNEVMPDIQRTQQMPQWLDRPEQPKPEHENINQFRRSSLQKSATKEDRAIILYKAMTQAGYNMSTLGPVMEMAKVIAKYDVQDPMAAEVAGLDEKAWQAILDKGAVGKQINVKPVSVPKYTEEQLKPVPEAPAPAAPQPAPAAPPAVEPAAPPTPAAPSVEKPPAAPSPEKEEGKLKYEELTKKLRDINKTYQEAQQLYDEGVLSEVEFDKMENQIEVQRKNTLALLEKYKQFKPKIVAPSPQPIKRGPSQRDVGRPATPREPLDPNERAKWRKKWPSMGDVKVSDGKVNYPMGVPLAVGVAEPGDDRRFPAVVGMIVFNVSRNQAGVVKGLTRGANGKYNLVVRELILKDVQESGMPLSPDKIVNEDPEYRAKTKLGDMLEWPETDDIQVNWKAQEYIRKYSGIVTMAQVVGQTPTVGQTPQQQPNTTTAPPVDNKGVPVQVGDYLKQAPNAAPNPGGEGKVKEVKPDGSILFQSPDGQEKVHNPDEQFEVAKQG